MRPPRGAPGGRPRPQQKGELRGRLALARALSKFGVCSRKQAAQWIADGRVRVAGAVVRWPARRIDPRRDTVTVDGRRVRDLSESLVIALHKPRGYITTRSEPGLNGRVLLYPRGRVLGARDGPDCLSRKSRLLRFRRSCGTFPRCDAAPAQSVFFQ